MPLFTHAVIRFLALFLLAFPVYAATPTQIDLPTQVKGVLPIANTNPLIQCVTAGGTVDAVTINVAPYIALTDKLSICLVSAGANTLTTPTFAPNSLTVHVITTRGGGALLPGDIGPSGFGAILEYNLANTRWELLNPEKTLGADVVGAVGAPTTSAAVTGAAQTAITSVGTLSGLTVTAPIAGSVTGTSATVTGAAQTAITSVG